jgi:hypothetical protein
MSYALRLPLFLAVIFTMLAAGCMGDTLNVGTDTPTDPALLDTPDGELVTKAVDWGKGTSTLYTPYEDDAPDWTWDFVTSQHYNGGSLNVWNDATTLYLEYQLDGYMMDEAMVLVSPIQPGPKSGNPGQFPYKMDFPGPVDSYTFEVPLAMFGGKSKLYIAAYAHSTDDDGMWAGYFNDGHPYWDFNWKKWGGGFCTRVMPIPALGGGLDGSAAYKGYHWGTFSYWDVLFTEPVMLPPGSYFNDGSNGRPEGDYYVGWCVDQGHVIRSGYPYEVKLYSSYDPNKPDWAASDNWDMVNYIINQRRQGAYDEFGGFEDNNENKNLFQNAVWYFIGVVASPPPGSGICGVPDYVPGGEGLYNAVIDDALANGENYIPGPGEYYAVVLFDKQRALTNGEQRFQMNIIEVDP